MICPMTRLIYILLSLLFSLSGSAMAKYSVTAYSGSNPTAAGFVRETRYSWDVDASGTLERGGATGGRNLQAYVGNSPVNGTDFLGMATTFFNQSGRGFSGGLFSGAGFYSISTHVWGGFGSLNHGIYHYAPPINVRDYVNYQSTVFDTRFASVATRVETVFKNASFSYNTWTVAEGHFYGKEPNLAKFDQRYQSQLAELLDEAGIGGEGRLVLFDQLEGLKDLLDRNIYSFGARNLEMIAGGMEVPGILTEAAGKAVMSPWSDAVAAFGGYDAYTGEEASRLQGASMLAVGLLSGPLDDVVRGAGALRYVDNAAESAALGGRSVLAAKTAPEMFYIENGVRRSLVSQNAGLTEIPATIFVPGRAPTTTTLRLDQLLSPKTTVPLDSRYLRIQPPIVSPIQVQPLGLPGQLPSVPLRNVILE